MTIRKADSPFILLEEGRKTLFPIFSTPGFEERTIAANGGDRSLRVAIDVRYPHKSSCIQ
jgi:hypothetical protein